MSLRRTAPPVALLVCLALLAAALAPLAGAQRPHATKVVVSLKFPAFHGSLQSSDDGCLAGRKVSVTRTRAGKKKSLGSTASNARGRWKVPVKNLSSGEYVVNVAPKGECKGARSKALTID